MNALPFLMSRIFNTPLMVLPARLDAFLVGLPALLLEGGRVNFGARSFDADDAPAQERPVGYTIRDGVARLPLHGVLVRRAGQMTPDCQPLLSYEVIARRLAAVTRDSRVRGTILDIDSPGGEAGGVFDLAAEIHTAAQIKPIWAVANDDSLSAAYALASGANRIWVSGTGCVGSIGVVALHADKSEQDAKEGLRYTYIHAGARKIDGHPHGPLSTEAHSRISGEITRLHELFAEAVASHRGLTREAVLATEAAVYYGPEAIQARLADQVGTIADAESALAVQVNQRHTPRKATAMSERPDTTEPGNAPPAPAPAPAPVPSPAPAPEMALDADGLTAKQARKAEKRRTEATVTEPSATADVIAMAAGHRAEATARAAEISELCLAADKPGLATSLMRSAMTTDQVRRHLLDLKAQDAAAPVVAVDTGAAAAAAGPALPKRMTSAESFSVLNKRSA